MAASNQAFPNPWASQDEKLKPQYGLKYLRAALDEWRGTGAVQGSSSISSIPINRYGYLKMCRQYRDATQDTARYQDMMNFEMGEAKNLYVNINYRPLPIMPRVINEIVGRISSAKYEVRCEATDAKSATQRDKDFKQMRRDLIHNKMMDEYKKLSGIELPKKELKADTDEGLEVYMDVTYKQAVEVAAEMGVQTTFDRNNFNELRRQLVDDAATYGFLGTNTTIQNSRISIRRVDPENAVFSYSKDPSMDGMQHAGEVSVMTIADLRALDTDNVLSEKDWEKVAQRASKSNNTESASQNLIFGSVSNLAYRDYDSFQVTVLRLEVRLPDIVKGEERTNSLGVARYYRKKDNYVSGKNKVHQKTVTNLYTGLYILDTDYIIGWGRKRNMQRPNSRKEDVVSGYNFYMTESYRNHNTSLVWRLITHVDQMHLATYKMQQIMSQMRPTEVAIDVDKLMDIVLDGGEVPTSPMELLSIFKQSGIQLYKSLNADGDPQSASPAIRDMATGAENVKLTALVGQFNFHKAELLDGIGRPEFNPSNETPVGTQKFQYASYNNATKFLVDALISVVKRTATVTFLAYQDIIRYDKNFTVDSIGRGAVVTIEVLKEMTLRDMSIFFDVAVDDNDRLLLEDNIRTAMDRKLIKLEDAITIRGMVNTKLANRYLSYMTKKREAEEQERAMAMEQQKAELQAQAQAQVEQIKQQTLALEMQKIQAEEAAKMQREIAVLETEYRLKAQLLQMQMGVQMSEKQQKVESELGKEEYKQDRVDERQREAIKGKEQLDKVRRGEQNEVVLEGGGIDKYL